MVDVARIQIVDYEYDVGEESKDFLLGEQYPVSLINKFLEISLLVEFLNDALMVIRANIIINNLNDERTCVLSHKFDLFFYILILFL